MINQTDNNYFSLLKEIFTEAKILLKETFENEVTDYLLKKQIKGNFKNGVYFCDFLGQGDLNSFGEKRPSNDDCLFTTAQAINILIATWTVHQNETGRLIWKVSVPQMVKSLVDSATNWLKENILGNNYKHMNAFFSGSVKGFKTVPFFYPANFIQYINGSSYDPNNFDRLNMDNILVGVQGWFFCKHTS